MSLSFTIEGSALTVHDFRDRFDYWTRQDWRDRITSLVLDDSIAEIPEGAFQYFRNLEYVRLPESLKRIGASAFSQCEALKEIALPEGLESLGEYAFQDTTGLRTLSLPASLTELGEQALYIGSGSRLKAVHAAKREPCLQVHRWSPVQCGHDPAHQIPFRQARGGIPGA